MSEEQEAYKRGYAQADNKAILEAVRVKQSYLDENERLSNLLLVAVGRIEQLLAQPEQEPVVWQVIGIAGFMYVYNQPIDQVYEHHTVNALYLAPPKREPLTSKLISLGNNCHESFIKGVRFAEEMHGIGGGE